MSDCKETIAHLHQFIDRELTEDEMRHVQEHLDLCPPCLDHFQFERNVLTLVGNRCRETTAPTTLRSRVQKLCTSSSPVENE